MMVLEEPLIKPDTMVGLPVAVPLYVKLAFNKKYRDRKRSAAITKLLCDHLDLPIPEKTIRTLEAPLKKRRGK